MTTRIGVKFVYQKVQLGAYEKFVLWVIDATIH